MEMNFKLFTMTLNQIAERNRDLASDNLIKSYAPNAKDLCTQKIDFAGVMNDIKSGISPDQALSKNTITSKTMPSRRIAALEMSQATMANIAMTRLLSHAIKEEKGIIESFRPN